MKKKIVAKDRLHLISIIENEVAFYGINCDLNHIDVSQVEAMHDLFTTIEFNGDISKWDVSNVKNMGNTFNQSKFNGDISQWNVSKVQLMNAMFSQSKFNGDILGWDISNVVDMSYMFFKSKFTGDLSEWKPYKLIDCSYAFEGCSNYAPYWSKFETLKKRKTAIDNYVLHKELNDDLQSSNSSKRKIKI